MEKIRVNLGENSYYIYTGYPLEKIGKFLDEKKFGEKLVILSDFNVFSFWGDIVKNSIKNKKIKVVLIPPGEKEKNIKRVLKIIEELLSFKVERNDTILNLGGGVISDIGGFVASIYKRGINYISVPTTLLAQVDASIGGKTGINLKYGKNLVGTFYQPSFVYIDLKTLSTLPKNQIKEGLAEIIKYGIIKNKKIFETLENISFEDLKNYYEFLIKESVKIKVEIVEKDEKEKKGLREILNFGHTLGHAIEISNIRRFSHGKAISLGMIGETFISFKKGICERGVFERVTNLIRKMNLCYSFKGINLDEITEFMKHDKKIKEGMIRFILPEKIGKVKVGIPIREVEVKSILREIIKDGED